MGKRSPNTTKSAIVSAMRMCWMRSRERRGAIRLAKNTCKLCGAKGRAKDTRNGPKKKIEVHHRRRPNWDALVQLFRDELLQNAEDYDILCHECHHDTHAGDKNVRLVKKDATQRKRPAVKRVK